MKNEKLLLGVGLLVAIAALVYWLYKNKKIELFGLNPCAGTYCPDSATRCKPCKNRSGPLTPLSNCEPASDYPNCTWTGDINCCTMLRCVETGLCKTQ